MKLGNGHLWVESIRDLPDRVKNGRRYQFERHVISLSRGGHRE